ncbi:MAG: helix-turn-helix domain-containing protein [Micromonosporaceae bacterium]
MRARFEHIEATAHLSWTLFVRRADRFGFAWHYHREFELTLITRGAGTRFLGDSVEDYQPGDLTLIGPELPHTYASVGTGQEAVVAQFHRDSFGPGFFDRPEFAAVDVLLARATRGLHLPPGSAMPDDLIGLPPAEQTLGLLATLVQLARRDDVRPLASLPHGAPLNHTARDRMGAVLQLLHTEYSRPLSLARIAAAAHLTPTATSRFFRRTTGSTITSYLNALRVGAACRLLLETDRPIADIAADCGYPNLSHFNRQFRDLKRQSPRDFRARAYLGRGPR